MRSSQWRLTLAVLRLVQRYPAIWLALILAGGGWYGYEVRVARPALVYLGEPRVQDWRSPLTWNRTLRNDGFLVGYSDLRGDPLWVSYAVTPVPSSAPHLKRPAQFRSDWRNPTQVSHEDYSGSGYDRGHMAPNRALSLLRGRNAQWDTFLMTNVVPQRPTLNRQLWERLEEAELERFAPRFGKVWVLTGPVFDGHVERLPHAWRVEIPDAFYKIYAAPRSNAPPQVMALLIPQDAAPDDEAARYATSVDEVESRTGLDFFPELPVAEEARVEAVTNTEPWDLPGAAPYSQHHSAKKRN